jgi:3-oxoacyl-[acyl-carrier-protein] synthase II
MVTDNSATVITAWSAVSPFGLGRAALSAALRGGAVPAASAVPQAWLVPDDTACLVPDAALGDVLGRKGTRSMDRVTALAVAAVGRLLEDQQHHRAVATGERTALVLGTTTGSAQSMMDFTRDSFTGKKPFFVDPARFPNTVMNCAAGQSAIWHGLKGPNATVAGGRVAGLHALNYARRLLQAGRASTVLCGAVEELTRARSWLEWHSRHPDESGALLGEGCAVVLIEPAGGSVPGRPMAEVLAVEFGIFTSDGAATALAACVRRAVRRAAVQPETIWAVAPCGAPGAAGEHERAAIAAVVGDRQTVQVRPADVIGDTRAAAAAFQVAAVLAVAEGVPAAAGRLALITAVDAEGVVGCALLRIQPGTEEE